MICLRITVLFSDGASGVQFVTDSINCPFCSKPMMSGYMKRHIDSVHLKIKPFQCTSCDKSFSRNWDLKRHVKEVHMKIFRSKSLRSRSKKE